eukprot:scaffold39143_cov73-Phaeocystis_antarctica.AAC.1
MRHQRWLARDGVRKLGAVASGRLGSSSGPYAHAPSSVMLCRSSSMLLSSCDRSRQPTCYSLWQPLVKCCSIKLHLSGTQWELTQQKS